MEEEFSDSPERGGGQIQITIDGEKGTSKTWTYLSFPFSHRMAVFSYDGKVGRILNNPAFAKRVGTTHVTDAMKYVTDMTEKGYPEGAVKTHNFILWCLKQRQKENWDWIVHDGLDVLAEVQEQRARGARGYTAYQPIGQFDPMWKMRKLGFRDIMNASLLAAKKGVIWVTYPRRVEVYQAGVLIETKSPPNWYDLIEKQTDIWLRCERVDNAKDRTTKYFVSIRGPKVAGWPEKTLETTGKHIFELLPPEAFGEHGFGSNPVVEIAEPKKDELAELFG